MATPNYDINYDDQRFTDVENQKQAAVSQTNNAYNEMINSSDKFYQDQINAINDYKNTQSEIQNANTDFTIKQIEQNKELSEKNYIKEQKGAYTDYQKQTNAYGANAEAMAAQGLTNTGLSESSQVSMFNTYQNRVSTARESYNQVVQGYDNQITQARLANNSELAKIAYDALQKGLELSLEGFQYKNSLIQEKMNKEQELDNTYYNRWQNVQNQINTENAMKEEVRQYNENMALQKEQLQEQKRQYEQDYALKVKQYNESIRQFDTQIAYYKQKDAQEYAFKIKQLEEQKRQAQQEQANWEKEYNLKVKQVNASLAKSSSSKSSSSKLTNGSSSSSSKLSNTSNSKSASSSNKTSAKYSSINNTARTLYNTSKSRSGSAFVEDYLARAINSGDITSSEAQKILGNLGIK